MPQYYGIALNRYSQSDSDFSKLFRDNHAIFKTVGVIVLTGALSGMASGILGNVLSLCLRFVQQWLTMLLLISIMF